MELWIRSQDKECLMKVDRLDYDLSNGTHRIMVDGYKTLIATYPTKKRCLEILDEINNKIKNQFIVKVNTLLKPSDTKKLKDQLEMNYNGDFIMNDPMLDIQPTTQNVVYYEMPKE